MRVEITVEGQEPVVHKLVKDKTMLGSGQDCDIPISADGISRKHLQVIVEGDQYFVVDQGSTNGSFINEDRLVPGQRASFTSFFPVKMGFHVTVALLSDEEAGTSFDFAKSLSITNEAAKNTTSPGTPRPSGSEKTGATRTAILNPLSASASAGTGSKRVEKAGPAAKRGPTTANPEKKESSSLKTLAFVIAFGGAAAFFYLREKPVDETAAPTVAAPVAQVAPAPNLSNYEFKPLRPIGLDNAASALTDQKCGSADEQAMCKALGLPAKDFTLSGVVLGQTAMTWVLPSLQGDAIATYFEKDTSWDEATRKKIIALQDARDLIGLFIASSSPSAWAKIPAEVRWIFVIFVNGTGGREGELWVADANYLRTLGTRLEEFYSLQTAMRAQGVDGVAPFAGMFRLASPPKEEAAESTP